MKIASGDISKWISIVSNRIKVKIKKKTSRTEMPTIIEHVKIEQGYALLSCFYEKNV